MRSASLILTLASAAFAADAAWTPPSHSFFCRLPEGWTAFEEETSAGTAAHLLGPDEAGGAYRAGIDVHWAVPGRPGFVPMKNALEDLRRSDKATGRRATGIRRMPSGRGLARVFEVVETRRLPPESAPSAAVRLHHFVGVIEGRSSYFVIRLSSTEETYVDYRRDFVEFLKSFRPAEE